MKVLVRIRYNQALRLVPSLKDPNARYALRYVSWTRSSASEGLRVIRRAALYSEPMYSIANSENWAWSAMGVPYRGPGTASARPGSGTEADRRVRPEGDRGLCDRGLCDRAWV